MPLMTQQQARQLSALQLAFMGDTVCDLLTRSELMFTALPVKQMHQSATQIVNARAQAAQLQAVRHLLTQEELDIVQRARNAHIGHHAPQSATPEEYLTATGFEALMGYLFLTGQMNRAQMLFRLGRV